MKKILSILTMGIIIVGSLVTQTFACGAILGEDSIPDSLK
jgi:hypothetical protein